MGIPDEYAQVLGIVDAQALPQCAPSGFTIIDKWIGYDWLRRCDGMCVEGWPLSRNEE